jgi:hypothetical protein
MMVAGQKPDETAKENEEPEPQHSMVAGQRSDETE